ncbi:MAG: hypothetical protein HY553_22085 [Elusimicrobia bacterium]|nr:hypothetical protein [Elusimicrobiota bacterium]
MTLPAPLALLTVMHPTHASAAGRPAQAEVRPVERLQGFIAAEEGERSFLSTDAANETALAVALGKATDVWLEKNTEKSAGLLSALADEKETAALRSALARWSRAAATTAPGPCRTDRPVEWLHAFLADATAIAWTLRRPPQPPRDLATTGAPDAVPMVTPRMRERVSRALDRAF